MGHVTPSRRVVHVASVGVAGDFALIGGRTAWHLGRVLAQPRLRGQLEAMVARLAMPPEDRLDVLRACEALLKAGAEWRAISVSGSATRARPDEGRHSECVPSGASISAQEAAAILGLSDRRVRQLAPALGGWEDSGGRWRFSSERIGAEREHRTKGARDVG
jgi:hypothetical protein